MTELKRQGKILIVDDEWESAIVRAVSRRLDQEGWTTIVVTPQVKGPSGEAFEHAALYLIEEEHPDGVVLDVRFGDHRDDRFKGLEILQSIVEEHPRLPVLMFTQYAQGPERETAVRGTLRWDAQVDFVDKLASPEEVVLRLRRLIGRSPESIAVGDRIVVDTRAKVVYVKETGEPVMVNEIQGMKFEILRELVTTWFRSPGELVPFNRLERYSEGDDARASLRVRIREIKDSLGKAMGQRFGADDLIINVRGQGYRLVAPKG